MKGLALGNLTQTNRVMNCLVYNAYKISNVGSCFRYIVIISNIDDQKELACIMLVNITVRRASTGLDKFGALNLLESLFAFI